MKKLKLAILIVVMLSIGFIIGCQSDVIEASEKEQENNKFSLIYKQESKQFKYYIFEDNDTKKQFVMIEDQFLSDIVMCPR